MAQQQPQDMKKIFINEIRSRIEAYFKLIVRNLRDSIPKTIGMNLVKSIEENMQITLYNMLYKSQEVVNVLNEPESVMIRRKELTEQIKVLRDAQRIIRRDPDLMQVMQIDINDSDISGHGKKEEGSQKTGSSSTVKTSAPVETKVMVPLRRQNHPQHQSLKALVIYSERLKSELTVNSIIIIKNDKI